MYEFTNMHTIGQGGHVSTNQLMLHKSSIDELVETEYGIEGVEITTLTVSGRGLAQRKHSVHEEDGLDGSKMQTLNLLPRTLNVKLKIKADSNAQLRQAYDFLNYLLTVGEIITIGFTDDPYEYMGYYVSSTEPEDVKNEQMLDLTFYCPDPLKYEPFRTTVELTNGERLTVASGYTSARLPLVRPNFKIEFAEPVSEFTLTANDFYNPRVLKVRSDTPRAIWEIILDERFTLPYSGLVGKVSVTNLEHLELDSDFIDFGVRGAQEFTVTPAPLKITVMYIGAML